MRIVIAVAAFCSLALSAFAADTEGTITRVDQEKLTITLDDGQTYKLPSEMDVTALKNGMNVVVAYQEVDDGVKQITDMLLPE